MHTNEIAAKECVDPECGCAKPELVAATVRLWLWLCSILRSSGAARPAILQTAVAIGTYAIGAIHPELSDSRSGLRTTKTVRAIQCFGQRSDSQIAFQPTAGFGIARIACRPAIMTLVTNRSGWRLRVVEV